MVEFDYIILTKSYSEIVGALIDIPNLKSEKIRGQTMQRSIHYYVLSLSEQTSRFYEGFRDKLIDIQNTNFPFEISIDAGLPASKDSQLREFFQQTKQHFDQYYEQDPLRLVVVGEKSNLAIFGALMTQQDVLIGMVEGDYTATSPHDLGMIVWPVVKEAIAGANKNAMRDLTTAAKLKKVVSGIDAVGQLVETETGSTLYVEEDYHVKGSIRKTDHSLIISKHVNLLEVIDDVVDLIIEKVLKMGGTVIFLNSGSLITFERIALILRD
ncbi:MAG TPA: hypothetical protein VGD14_16540 [bacterium]